MTVDGFGRAIAGVGVVEVGQDVPGSAFECPAQRDDFCEGARHARADGEALARCADDTHPRHCQRDARREKGSMTALASGSSSMAALLKPGESIHRDDLDALAPSVGLGGQPGFKDPLGAARDHVQEPRGTATVSYGRHVQDDVNEFVAVGGVAPHVSTLWAPVAAHAHMQDRGTPLAGYVRQAPDHRVTRNALAPAASTPPALTSNTARQHCMVWLNALTPHLQPQAIQASERAQIEAIKDSIGHVEVFQMDGVGISIIGRPRPLPGHDTPNSAYNTYTLKCEEPVSGPDLLDGLFAPYGGCIELPHTCVFGAACARFAGGVPPR